MTTPSIGERHVDGALLSGERRVLELIANGTALPKVLEALCGVIDEQSGLMSSVFLLDRRREQLFLAAGPHLPDLWSRAARSFPAAPTSTACGAAVSRREQVIVDDVLRSALYRGWEDAARAARIGAVWSTPIFSKDGDVLGTFAVYDRQPGTPKDKDLDLVARATHLASTAIERHRTAESLRESEIRFSRAFDANPACMTITRFSDGRFVCINHAFVRMFGYSRDEAIGHTALDLHLYADRTQRSALMQRLANRTLHDVEVKARTKSGEILDLMVSMEPVEIDGENCVLQIASDITARKRAEEALRHSEKRWRSVFDNSAIGIKVGDSTLRVTAANRAVQELGGYNERELTSRTFLDLTHPDDRYLILEATAELRAGRARERQLEKRYLRKDGVAIWVRGTLSLIQETNEAPQFLELLEDISARKMAERELHDSLGHMKDLTARLMRAQDDERRRIAQMLHETAAQDLAALKMLLSRLGRTATALSDDDRMLIAESIELADRSMAGVRTLSYLLHPPFLDEMGLTSALRWYAKGFADRSGIGVELDLPGSFDRLPQEMELALFRVVQEALINVLRHAQSPTALIRLRRDGAGVTLEVEDRGRGFPMGLASRLAAGKGAVGMGVGIAGVRERLEQLSGTLDIESSDRGTIIRAVLPSAPARR